MSWLDRYSFRLYVRNSIWIFPALSIVIGLILVILFNRLERALGWELEVSQETARMVMSTVAASMFTMVVVCTSAVLLVVQLASAQLTPRIIALVYRNNLRKLSLAVFVFTFTFSVGVLVRIEDSVPLLTTYIAAYGFLINLALFLYFIDSIGKTVRPSSALKVVGLAGREVIQNVYPTRLKREDPSVANPIELLKRDPTRVILNEVDGVILAFDHRGLLLLAERSNCLIELVPEVGDFVAAGDPLFRIFEGGQELSGERLRKSVALGQERTLEQDPMYAFRIIVDIASKALSPAINDPTTAVLAIDQIHHLLRDVGCRNLAEGHEVDKAGQVRLVYRTPNWDDFVHLAVTEIRQYGRDSIQIMRRLRAMLENLVETLPRRRAPLLRLELSLLVSSSKRMFPDLDDQVLAETGDLQGMGGGDKRREHIFSDRVDSMEILPIGNLKIMPTWLYEISPPVAAIIMVVFIESVALIGLVLVRQLLIPWLHYDRDANDAVSGTVQAIGVFYGITVGLIAVGVWNTNSHASELVSKEAASIGALYRDVSGYPLPERIGLRWKLREYTVFIIDEAWPAQKRGQGQLVHGGVKLLDDFQDELYSFKPANMSQAALHGETLRAYNTLIEYRRLRIDAVGGGLSMVMWAVIWVGAAISIGVAYFFNIPDLKLHAILVALMGGFLAMVLFMIVINDKPFYGSVSISPEPYKLILEHLIDVSG